MRTQLRLVWVPAGGDSASRIPVMDQMWNAKMPAKAVDAMLADSVECTADVEIYDDGTIELISVRKAMKCASLKHINGVGQVRCEHTETHPGKCAAAVRYKDGDVAFETWQRQAV